MKTNVKIPEKHYVGMVKRPNDHLPLGFMTPWGEDKAARQRMDTVDRWARGTEKLEPMVIDNLPLSGFRLTKSIRTTNYGGHDHWRVEDPRGFELEITSGNLAQLLSVGTLDRGDILDECVWARYGKDNVLLSTATAEYREAVENTRVAGVKSSWREARLGNRVVLQNNTKGLWLGRMHHVTHGYNTSGDSSIGDNEIQISSNPLHLLLTEESHTRWTQTLEMISTPKLSYIDDAGTVIDAAEAERYALELLTDEQTYVQTSGYRDPLVAAFDTIRCGENLTLSLVPITESDPDEILRLIQTYDGPKLFGKHGNGSFGLLSKYSGDTNPKMTHYSRPWLDQHELRKDMVPSNKPRTWHGSKSSAFTEHRVECPLADLTGLYHLNINIKTAAGNSLDSLLR
jgi:hypothetical protein